MDTDVGYLPDSRDVTDFSVYAIPARGVEITRLEQAIDHELAAIGATGVSRTEVMRAQRHLQHDAAFTPEHSHEVAETLGVALTTGRTIADVEQWGARIARVTQEQIQAAARAVLRAEWSVTGVLLSASADDAACIEELRSEKP